MPVGSILKCLSLNFLGYKIYKLHSFILGLTHQLDCIFGFTSLHVWIFWTRLPSIELTASETEFLAVSDNTTSHTAIWARKNFISEVVSSSPGWVSFKMVNFRSLYADLNPWLWEGLCQFESSCNLCTYIYKWFE